MTDCPNAEMRDRLPDLLHDRLSASARATVMAHVSNCAECRDELALLRGVRAAFDARTPRVDVAYIVGALPKPVIRRPQVAPTRRRIWTDWRVAAAVTLLVGGGTSVAVFNRVAVPNVPVASIPLDQDSGLAKVAATRNSGVKTAQPTRAPITVQAPSRATAPSAETVASADDQTSTADAATEGRLGELSAPQLKALLDDISRLPAVPVTDPEPVTIRVNNRGSSLSPDGQ